MLRAFFAGSNVKSTDLSYMQQIEGAKLRISRDLDNSQDRPGGF
jgi:hypothetical protein